MQIVLKYRFNNGQRSNLYFYRDSKGNEVDLLFVKGSDLFPIEIKAGMTLVKDFFKGLTNFAKVFPDHIPNGSGLVYGGKEAQQRTRVSIVPLARLNTLFQLASRI